MASIREDHTFEVGQSFHFYDYYGRRTSVIITSIQDEVQESWVRTGEMINVYRIHFDVLTPEAEHNARGNYNHAGLVHWLNEQLKDSAELFPTLSGQRVFHFYSDPGHGWVKVLQDDLIALGIANDISTFSYRRGKWAYLEEDSDASKWNIAFQNATGKEPKFKAHYADKASKIRGYNYYQSSMAEVS